MSRKIVNIKSAKLPKDKPFIHMTERELDETFMDLQGGLDEGILERARSTEQKVCLISVVLALRDGSERLAATYEEYGDHDNEELIDDLIRKMTPFLHPKESLRAATHEVDLTKALPFKFPSKKALKEHYYRWLHHTRGLPTVLVTWLVSGKSRRVHCWNMDHGDGDGMSTFATPQAKSTAWNKLLAKDERLEIIAYVLPPEALREIPSV